MVGRDQKHLIFLRSVFVQSMQFVVIDSFCSQRLVLFDCRIIWSFGDCLLCLILCEHAGGEKKPTVKFQGIYKYFYQQVFFFSQVGFPWSFTYGSF